MTVDAFASPHPTEIEVAMIIATLVRFIVKWFSNRKQNSDSPSDGADVRRVDRA